MAPRLHFSMAYHFVCKMFIKKMGSTCLFLRQQALKMGYFRWLRVKSSNHVHTELSRGYLKLKTQNFILKVKLVLFT